MKNLIFSLALAIVATVALADEPVTVKDSDKVIVMRDGNSVLMLPAEYQERNTYLVIQRNEDKVVVPYSSAKDCKEFATELGGRCISGVDVIKHRFERQF